MTEEREKEGSKEGERDSEDRNSILSWYSPRKSLLLKFGISFFVIVLMVGGVGYVMMNQSSNAVKEDVEKKMVLQTTSEARGINEWVKRNKIPARMISDDNVFAQNASQVGPYLEKQLRKTPDEVVEIHWANLKNRKILESTTEDIEGTSFVNAEWNLQTFELNSFDEVIVSEPYMNSNGKSVIAFISAVRERFNTIVVVTVDVSEMNTNFHNPINGSFTQVVNSEGTIMFAENEEAILRPYVKTDLSSKVVSKGIYQEPGFVEEGLKERELEKDHVMAFAPVEESDWVVVKHAPTNKAYGLVSRIGWWILVSIGVVILGVVGVGATFGRNVVSSIKRLSKKARKIESGEYEVSLNTSRRDEIGVLYNAFESMRDTLHRRLIETEEAKVEAQKAKIELEKANEELEEQKIITSVLNRILRHNLRNGMNVITGRAGIMVEATDDDQIERNAELIKKQAEELVEKADKARKMEELMETENLEPEKVNVVEIIREEVEKFREDYPNASIKANLPKEKEIIGYEVVSFVFTILIENAIVHNDSPEPVVEVNVSSTEKDDKKIEVEIKDNGPGIPEREKEVIEKEEETPLHHGSGFGLWIANWIMKKVDGEILFEDNHPRGTIVKTRFRKAREDIEKTEAD